jgi:hypothetical protein
MLFFFKSLSSFNQITLVLKIYNQKNEPHATDSSGILFQFSFEIEKDTAKSG